jgi:toxin YhaV
MERNGWTLYYFPLFKDRLDALEQKLTDLAEKHPQRLASHPQAKLLKKVLLAIENEVPHNPAAPTFELGHTLGVENAHWRRVKDRLPPRYRLFFQFASSDNKIIYAWLNDEASLRKDGSKSDVYVVFQRLLRQNRVPSDYATLLAQSRSPE